VRNANLLLQAAKRQRCGLLKDAIAKMIERVTAVSQIQEQQNQSALAVALIVACTFTPCFAESATLLRLHSVAFRLCRQRRRGKRSRRRLSSEEIRGRLGSLC